MQMSSAFQGRGGGSSYEGIAVAEALQARLDEVAEVTLWTQGIFDPGANFLEALIKTLDTTDFAILVMTPDDVILSGDEVSLAPRDNVLFELGLFMGRLGRERCFFVHERDLKLKISSDLLGISAVKYRRFAQRQFEGRVGKRASDIKDRITSLDRRLRLRLLQQEGAARADVPDISHDSATRRTFRITTVSWKSNSPVC